MIRLIYFTVFVVLFSSCGRNRTDTSLYCLDLDSVSDTLTVDIKNLVDSFQYYTIPSPNYRTAISERYICVSPYMYAPECYLVDRTHPNEYAVVNLYSDERITDILIDDKFGHLFIAHTNGYIACYDLVTAEFKDSETIELKVPLLFSNSDGSVTAYTVRNGMWREPFSCATVLFNENKSNAIRYSSKDELVGWPDEYGDLHSWPYTSRNFSPALIGLSDCNTLFAYNPESNLIYPVFYINSPDSTYNIDFSQSIELPNIFLTKILGVDDMIATSKQSSASKFIKINDAQNGTKVQLYNFVDGYYVRSQTKEISPDSTAHTLLLGKINNYDLY